MTSITTVLNHDSRGKIARQLLGEDEINPDLIESYQNYSDIYHARHDLMHAAICDKLCIPFGEKEVDVVLSSHKIVLSTHSFYEQVKKQTPDYLGIKGNVIDIIEVTVSTDLNARNKKSAKYALLCKVLRDVGFELNYRIFVFDPKNVYINRMDMIRDGLDDLTLDFASKICQNTASLLREVHKTIRGNGFYYKYFEINDSPVDLKITSEDTIRTHHNNKNKCFLSDDELYNVLSKPSFTTIDESDESFVDYVLQLAKNIEPEITSKEEFDSIGFIKQMKAQSTSVERRSVLPLPYLSTKIIDSSERTTTNDWFDVSMISSKMVLSTNAIINTIGHACRIHMNEIKDKNPIRNEDFLFVCRLGSELDRVNAIEGPNRKKYIKMGYQEHKKEQNKHDGYSLDPQTDVSDILHLSMLFSQKPKLKTSGDIISDMREILNMESIGVSYIKMCQTIYREININSMRGDRRHKYIIKPTGAKGVYICLYPGTKLRCGELANIVWFKIIVDNDLEDPDTNFVGSWVFKKLIRDVGVSYTRWLSCDVHRLDHYIRCHDKIIMAYGSIISQRFRSEYDEKQSQDNAVDSSLIKFMNSDSTNSLGLIILTYLEDRRSTSKMLQNIRYLVMTSISLFPKFKSTMDKFTDAIRSPLQLYYLQKSLRYVEEMKRHKLYNSTKFGPISYDHKTHMFLDAFGGSLVKLPRPLVDGGSDFVDFSEILCEMYFTMLFNKNQDDPTHASFQILDKIIEGENSFQEVKSNGNHLGYRDDMDDLMFASMIIKEPHTHQFSRKAIEIGSKLLRLDLDDPFGDQILVASQKNNLNKTLDEFATFKSSSQLVNTTFSMESKRQNPRVRCIEAVNKLLKEGLWKTFDVVEKYRDSETYYHVFKKNQIGGVREILILPMEVRIRINVLETLSRNICQYDRREVLTHGVKKNESIKSALYTSKKYKGLRVPIHITFDKSKWGPSFVPIQFLYLFTPFKKQLGTLFPFIVDLLIKHQNKECVLPDRLVRAWYYDEKNTHKHTFPGLQSLKESFLKTKSLMYKNESNMGQGILHYTSSLLHLCMISFRDKLYYKWLKEIGMESKDHEDLLSSDDSYTIFCPELTEGPKKATSVKTKLMIFLKCQQAAEYLFNCRTSKVKSSINPLIGEFNSLFISNMSFIPTLFKFALSSVHPVNTDSFYRMVKESYGSSRQIVENGGGLDLYTLAQLFNQKFCEEIYHTNSGGFNDFQNWGLKQVPYHLGRYPIFNPALMVCFGPEYFNYKIYKSSWNNLTPEEKQLFKSSHKIIKGGLVETMAEFEDGDTVLGGMMRIEAMMGPIEQLNRIRNSALMTKESLSKVILDNPLIILNKPKSIQDAIFKVTHKLYTTGSKEGLKNIAASIYYGRVSATVSANVFYIPSGSDEKIIGRKYSDCLQQMINIESDYLKIEEQINFLYPKHVDYDLFINKDDFKLELLPRNPMEIQTVQNLVTHKIYTKLTQPVPDILSYKWTEKIVPEHLTTKVERDFTLIKQHFPLIKETMELTKKQFDGDNLQQTKSLLLVILKLYSLKDKNFKGVIYGMGSNDIQRTYSTLMERNYSNSLSAIIRDEEYKQYNKMTFDKINCAHNHTILSEFSETKISGNIWETINERDLMLYFQDPTINQNIKKRVFMVAITNGFIKNADDWSEKVGIILHYWLKKQQYVDKRYFGSFEILLYMGKKKLNCTYNFSSGKYTFQKQNIDDPVILKTFFDELSGLIGIKLDDILKKTRIGPWMLIDDKILQTNGEGFQLKDVEQLVSISLDYCKLEIDEQWTRLVDNERYRVFNIETGLIASDYVPDKIYDFRVFGLSFVDICSIGSVNHNFNVLYMSKTTTLDILHDMDVARPRVSKFTKKRLPFTNSWGESIEEKIEESVLIEDTTSFMDQFKALELTEDDFKFVAKAYEETDPIEEMVNFLLSTDAIYSMQTSHRIQMSRKIFLIVKNLKYDIICHHLLIDFKISSQTIKTAKKIIKPEFKESIEYSLVSLYDRCNYHEGSKSPEGIFFSINAGFLKKFQVASDEDE